jgi:hypothetical protein
MSNAAARTAEESDVSDDDHLRRPRHSTRNRGWQGEQLELEHSLEPKTSTCVAVDLQQFRNTVVGQGYQAKHVVRQKGLPTSENENKRLAEPRKHQKCNDNSISGRTTPKKRKSESERGDGGPELSAETTKLQRYLQCAGLRRFRKELANIEVRREYIHM